MTHPSGLDRKHPAWVDRMKRAEGGAADDDSPLLHEAQTADQTTFLNTPYTQQAQEAHMQNAGNEPVKRDRSKDNDYP